jgi:hypothetical protein
VKPKSVARDLFERAMTFGEYIDFYGLKHSEGAVLRYLSDVYKGLFQNVPVDAGSDELDEIVHWLGCARPVGRLEPARRVGAAPPARSAHSGRRPARCRARRRPRRHHRRRADVPDDGPQPCVPLGRAAVATTAPGRRVDDVAILDELAAYWVEYDSIETNGDARHASRFAFDGASGSIVQTLHDPEGHDEWRVLGRSTSQPPGPRVAWSRRWSASPDSESRPEG